MAIPLHTHSGILPPYVGPDDLAHLPGNRSPYRVTVMDVVRRYATNERRVDILTGLLGYRQMLREAGVTNGFQWLDGGFVDAKPDPKDVDVVVFYEPPAGVSAAEFEMRLFEEHEELFDTDKMKERFRCDPYPVALGLDRRTLVKWTHYWHGLFSHNREKLHRGYLEVGLADDDALAVSLLVEARAAL